MNNEFPVPHQVYLDAKHYVEQKKIPFFDFYRNCVFGFVPKITGKSGWFAHVVLAEDGTLDNECRCGEADTDELCAHGLALFMKMVNFPFERRNLSDAFNAFPLVHFFRKIASRLHGKVMHPNTNPALTLPEGLADPRMMNYWGFKLDSEGQKLADRDRRAAEKARRLCRTGGEISMLRKGFPSPLVQFEEGPLYNLCKLFFHLDDAGLLHVSVQSAPNHEVVLSISSEGQELFRWLMPVNVYLKGIGEDKSWWAERADFEMRAASIPIVYRIGFTEDNRLEIEPRIMVSENLHIGLDEGAVPGNRGLYFHEALGYFRVQTGLSPFEMEFSEPGVRIINHDKVKSFLAQHRGTLQALDRALMDEGVFGEVVTEHFEELTLDLSAFEEGWFGYQMEAKLGDHVFDTETLRALFRHSGRYHKMAGKLFDASGYDGVYLQPLYAQDRNDDRLHVSDLFRIMAFFKGRLTVNTNTLTGGVYDDLANFQGPAAPSLDAIQLQLRDYQKVGYHWLYFLKSFGLGGLLCDQMGLGKTHQGMALLSSVLADGEDRRAVVVAPASVVFHWKDKLNTFCPGIRAAVYHGSDRRPHSTLQRFQVMITTYGTLRNDIDLFEENLFDLVLFDEIQNLKNKDTKMYQGLSRLKARCKVGLTGTPIENQIQELKNLLDIVFPGYLGSDAQFRKFFVDPIVKFNSEHAKEKVRGMIKPFILRRNKSEVLLELPPKVEDVRNYDLTEYEKELYQEVKKIGSNRMKEDPDNSLHVWALINKLKMICNHPALHFGNTEYNAYPSTKWQMFCELLEEAMDSGQKVVIFTQYLGMVDMIARYLNANDIAYASITGKTREREREQRRFQEDPECRVFVGSIKAAGVGIDLTAASIAIHYDRWWNPAVEEQATDRIHRIGQEKSVQVFKFRGTGTVEERIDRIIDRKRGLLEDVVGFDAEAVSKTLSMDELLNILS